MATILLSPPRYPPPAPLPDLQILDEHVPRWVKAPRAPGAWEFSEACAQEGFTSAAADLGLLRPDALADRSCFFRDGAALETLCEYMTLVLFERRLTRAFYASGGNASGARLLAEVGGLGGEERERTALSSMVPERCVTRLHRSWDAVHLEMPLRVGIRRHPSDAASAWMHGFAYMWSQFMELWMLRRHAAASAGFSPATAVALAGEGLQWSMNGDWNRSQVVCQLARRVWRELQSRQPEQHRRHPLLRIAEVGVFQGRIPLLVLSRRCWGPSGRPPLQYHLIDPWEENEEFASMRQWAVGSSAGDALTGEAVFSELRLQLSSLAPDLPVEVVPDGVVIGEDRPGVFMHRKLSERAFGSIASVHLSFIDGDHSLEGITGDLLGMAPRTRCVLAGHDYAMSRFPGIPIALSRFLGSRVAPRFHGQTLYLDSDFVWWVRSDCSSS